MKRTFIAVALSLLIVGATGASATQKTAAQKAAPDSMSPQKKRLTIAWSSYGEQFLPVATDTKGARAEARRLGVKFVVFDAKGDASKQASDIQDMIAQRPDGILIIPVDAVGSEKLVQQINKAGIPVMAVEELVGDPTKHPNLWVAPGLKAAVYIDNVTMGKQAGAIAAKILPSGGNVAVVLLPPGLVANTLRVQGFETALKAAGVKYHIVAKQSGYSVPEKAQAACQNMLAANPNIDLFYVLEDSQEALPCAKAIQAAGSHAKLVTIGGQKLAVAAVKAGVIAGDVCIMLSAMGKLAVDTMYAFLTGKKHYNRTLVPFQTFGITKANANKCVTGY